MKASLPLALLLACGGSTFSEAEPVPEPVPQAPDGGPRPEAHDASAADVVTSAVDAGMVCTDDCPASPCETAGTRQCASASDACQVRIIVRCRVDGCEWRTYSSLTPFATPEAFRTEREAARAACAERGGTTE